MDGKARYRSWRALFVSDIRPRYRSCDGIGSTLDGRNSASSPLPWWVERCTLRWLEFLIAKTKLLDQLRGRINPRQEKALLRMLREGPDGFEGGLSAGNYRAITRATPATAGRDLAGLVAMGALRRTGQLRGTRYWLTFAEEGDESDSAD